MKRSRGSIAAISLLLGACATPGPETTPPVGNIGVPPVSTEVTEITKVHVTPAPASQGELVCRREVRTGSHMATRVCRSREQIEEERIAAREAMRNTGNSMIKAEGFEPNVLNPQ